MQFTRAQADVFVHYAIGDNADTAPPSELQLLREIKGFAVNPASSSSSASSPDDVWHLGAMVCGPLSESTEGQWENFTLNYM